jgi:hypothetical protein
MGEKRLDQNWRYAGRLLSLTEVSLITGFAIETIRRLRRSGTLAASLNKRPFKFDPEHIYQVFFETKKLVLNDSVRSLKTEKSDPLARKPLTKEDMWPK